MYTILLWFKAGRLAVARDEIEPHRQHALSKATSEHQRAIINVRFDDAVEDVADDIHPLKILRRIFFN